LGWKTSPAAQLIARSSEGSSMAGVAEVAHPKLGEIKAYEHFLFVG
jgi:hypothetical protein